MLKKIITAQTMLFALLIFASPALADAGITKTGEKCDKTRQEECDKRHREICDKKDHSDCDKSYRKDCDKKRDHRRGDYRKGKKGFDILSLADEIGLSAKQVKKIKEIKSAHEKAEIMTGAEMDVLKLELKELKHDYSTDTKAFAAKVREIKTKEGDRKIAHFEMKKAIRKVMTTKQREKIKEYFKNKYKK